MNHGPPYPKSSRDQCGFPLFALTTLFFFFSICPQDHAHKPPIVRAPPQTPPSIPVFWGRCFCLRLFFVVLPIRTPLFFLRFKSSLPPAFSFSFHFLFLPMSLNRPRLGFLGYIVFPRFWFAFVCGSLDCLRCFFFGSANSPEHPPKPFPCCFRPMDCVFVLPRFDPPLPHCFFGVDVVFCFSHAIAFPFASPRDVATYTPFSVFPSNSIAVSPFLTWFAPHPPT